MREFITRSLSKIDKTVITRQFKVMVYTTLPNHINVMSTNTIKDNCQQNREIRKINACFRKWPRRPRCISNIVLYENVVLKLHREKHRCSKARLKMRLSESQVAAIRAIISKLRMVRKWIRDIAVHEAEFAFKHNDIVGQIQLLYFDLRPGPKILFEGNTPEGSDTFQRPVIERDRVGGLRLMIWDKVKVPLCHYSHAPEESNLWTAWQLFPLDDD